MLKPVSHKADIPFNYQQALDDFGISELLNKLNNYSDADFNSTAVNLEAAEAETLAALLIGQLTKNLTGKLITDYLNLLRNTKGAVISDLPAFELHSLQPITLPENFPQNTKTPRYWIGDRLRWKPLNENEPTDFGIAIGRFYTYAPHRASWAWKYLIWLDSNSPSSCTADTAWEFDLEPIEEVCQ